MVSTSIERKNLSNLRCAWHFVQYEFFRETSSPSGATTYPNEVVTTPGQRSRESLTLPRRRLGSILEGAGAPRMLSRPRATLRIEAHETEAGGRDELHPGPSF
jgi:hypothetical protein